MVAPARPPIRAPCPALPLFALPIRAPSPAPAAPPIPAPSAVWDIDEQPAPNGSTASAAVTVRNRRVMRILRGLGPPPRGTGGYAVRPVSCQAQREGVRGFGNAGNPGNRAAFRALDRPDLQLDIDRTCCGDSAVSQFWQHFVSNGGTEFEPA